MGRGHRPYTRLLGALALAATTLPPLASLAADAPPELTVCAECAYTGISAALEAAPAGATVRVRPGRYVSEGALVIRKPVSLIGEGRPVIDGAKLDDVIRIEGAPGVVIQGFQIRNSGFSYVREMAGIKVIEAGDCTLDDNELVDNNFGIYLANSKDCRITSNRIQGVIKSEADTGNGIHVWQGTGHLFSGNDLSASRDGIYFEFVNDSRIERNRSHGNLRYGLHFMNSNRDVYEQNVFTNNGAGVAVMYSRQITMNGNEFSESRGTAAYGLLLKEISESAVTRNRFDRNSVGIYMEGANRSRFESNTISNNGWALRLMGSCEGNRFVRNDFTGNTFDVTTNSRYSENEFVRNYWSHYDGYDLDRNGVGDRPFRLSSLSAIILERVDSSFILLHSFLFTLLDEVERALPELIPERLEDTEPSMRPTAGAANGSAA